MTQEIIKILHLSDLHLNENNWDQNIVLESFFKDLTLNIAPENSLDLVLFSGDLTNTGSENEFKFFKDNFLHKFCEILKIDQSKLIFSPGNHDIDRSVIDPISKKGLEELLTDREKANEIIQSFKIGSSHLSRLENFNNFINQLEYGEHRKSEALFSNYTYKFGSKTIGVTSLNTSWCAYGGEEDYGKLIIGERQIEEAIEGLKNVI